MDDRLRKQGSGGGAIARNIVGLGSNFLNKLRAHVFKRIFQFDFLRNGHTVVRDEGRAIFLVEHYVAAFGPQGDLDGIRQCVHAGLKGAAGFFAIFQLFCHDEFLLFL